MHLGQFSMSALRCIVLPAPGVSRENYLPSYGSPEVPRTEYPMHPTLSRALVDSRVWTGIFLSWTATPSQSFSAQLTGAFLSSYSTWRPVTLLVRRMPPVLTPKRTLPSSTPRSSTPTPDPAVCGRRFHPPLSRHRLNSCRNRRRFFLSSRAHALRTPRGHTRQSQYRYLPNVSSSATLRATASDPRRIHTVDCQRPQIGQEEEASSQTWRRHDTRCRRG